MVKFVPLLREYQYDTIKYVIFEKKKRYRYCFYIYLIIIAKNTVIGRIFH